MPIRDLIPSWRNRKPVAAERQESNPFMRLQAKSIRYSIRSLMILLCNHFKARHQVLPLVPIFAKQTRNILSNANCRDWMKRMSKSI